MFVLGFSITKIKPNKNVLLYSSEWEGIDKHTHVLYDWLTFLLRARAMERATLVLPTPGGPVKQRILPCAELLSWLTAMNSCSQEELQPMLFIRKKTLIYTYHLKVFKLLQSVLFLYWNILAQIMSTFSQRPLCSNGHNDDFVSPI